MINPLRFIMNPQEGSLKLQSIRAALWSLIEKGLGHFLRMLSSLILTRLLFPEAFGVMAAAQTVITMIQLLTDVGVRTAIIQNPKGAQPEFLDAVFILSVGRGLLLTLAIAALAWPVSLYYKQPQVLGILLILSLNPLILGFENPAVMVMVKRFLVERKVTLEVSTQLAGIVSAVVLAWLFRSVYALAASQLVTCLWRAAASFLITPYRPRLKWDPQLGGEIFSFGKLVFFNTMVSFTAMNVDIFVVGRVLGMESLGVYNIGRTMGMLVWTICLQVFMQSYLPAASSVQNDLPRVVRMYGTTTSMVLTLAIPLSMIMALFAPDVMGLLYDDRYAASSVAMFWFSLSGILLVLNAMNSNTFIALGKIRYDTASMAVGLFLMCALVPAGAGMYGLNGAGAGMLGSLFAVSLVQTFLLVRFLGFPASKALKPWFQITAISGSTALMFLVLRPLLQSTFLFNLPFILVMVLLAAMPSGLVFLSQRQALPAGGRNGNA